MSASKATSSAARGPAGGVPRNFPRPDAVPRKYGSRRDAEAVAAHYRSIRFFTNRGEPYSYACESCRVWHVGLHTGAKWHENRWKHDNYAEFIGSQPEAEQAA